MDKVTFRDQIDEGVCINCLSGTFKFQLYWMANYLMTKNLELLVRLLYADLVSWS